MKTHTGAARMLALPALAVLLALQGGARGACGPYTIPKITVNAEEWSKNQYSKRYGEDIMLHCSVKNGTHLEIEENRKSLEIMEVNTTTVQLSVKKPELGKHIYSCVDSDTGCEDSVTVNVRPAMSVESSRVHRYQRYVFLDYIVALGDDYEVFCSGHDSEALNIALSGEIKQQQTDVINSTSIKYRTQANRVGNTNYVCSGKVATGDAYMVYGGLRVTVDYYPECHTFWCGIYTYGGIRDVVECLWEYYSYNVIKFQLFYTDLTEGYEDATLLCGDNSGNVTTGKCKVDQFSTGRTLIYWNHNVSLLLMSCNSYLCNNQSYVMNTAAISIGNPVYNLKVLNTSAHGVALTWTNGYPYTNLANKVEYRQIQLDDVWRLADMSSVRCEKKEVYETCEYELNLPYPGTEYEVRVYARHKTATDDRVWSEPKSLVVATEPRVQECACSAAPDTPAEPTTTNSAEMKTSCEVCRYTEDTIKESLALKYKIRSMKKTLKTITNLIQVNKLLKNKD